MFTESGTTNSNFRANTEAGLSRKQQREQDLPLRGHLSDEDLTKKTNDELQSILSSQSRESMGKDTNGNNVGRIDREPVHDKFTREKEGSSREEPRKQKELVSPQTPDATNKDVQTPKYPKTGDVEKPDAKDVETESGGDPGMDFAREKLMEYLKNPGKLAMVFIATVSRI